MIPKQIKREGIKFVLLEKGGKKPFQKGWQNLTISHDDTGLVNHISTGGNYGVMGGGELGLIIIDFDNQKIQDKICPKLPKTFTVQTGTGKLHKYFTSDKHESFKIFDEDMNTLIDVQGEGKQVVGAGSVHPNGNKYKVIDDSEIAFISYSEVKALLLPFDKKPKKKEIIQERPKGILTDDFLDRLKSEIGMEQVLNSFGVDTSKNPTACPFHASKGGKCLGYNWETAHCFHCEGSWNIFSFVKKIKDTDFKEALSYLANLAGLEDELEKSKRKYLDSLEETEEAKKEKIRSKFLHLVSGKEKKWSEATEILVEFIKEKSHIYTTKDDFRSEVWIYKDGVYVPQGKSEIKIILRNLLQEWYSQFIFGQVITKIEADTFIDQEKFFTAKNQDEIPVINGILNIYSRELKPFSPERISFNKIQAEYNPQADCPLIDSFLKDILKSERDKDIFYEWGGFCLMGDYRFEKAMMCVGNGRNGKDKMLELLKRMLGIKNCCSVPLASLNPDSFVISELFGKRANLAGEISGQDLKDLSMFKALTGRSLISAKRKFKTDISFVNSAKFTFACNDLPMVYDLSKGFWDRWILLEFPYTFITKEELDKAENKNNLKIRDEEIIEKITSSKEMSGLLNRFLDGLDRLIVSRNFSTAEGSEEIKNKWIRKSNSFIAFCIDRIEESYDGRISKKELRKVYSWYCKEHKLLSKSDLVVRKVLQEIYGCTEIQTDSLGQYSGERLWEGIKWKK